LDDRSRPCRPLGRLGLRASRHALWDEGRGRMVTFAEAIRSNAQSDPP